MASRLVLSRRKFLGAALTAAVVTPILQACVGAQERATPAAGATSPSTTASPAITPSPATGTTPTAGAATDQLPYTSHTDVSGTVVFWHFWGSPLRRNAIRRVIGNFQQLYPNIRIEETFVPFGDIFTKAVAAVAAGSGMPDVFVDGVQVYQRVQNNIINELTPLAERDQVRADLFWPFTWAQANVDNRLYGLPYETDVRLLYYNKAQFSDAGLNPDQPPQNWDELWTAADRLDLINNGQIQRMGFHPLIGNIGLDQWVWNNGGEWQTEDYTPTINAPANVATLDWIKQWSDRYGKNNVDAFQGTFGPPGPQDRFMSGKMSSLVDIQGYVAFLNTFNPQLRTEGGEALGWGLARIPPAAGNNPASLSGGFALVNPRGSQAQEAMWEFAKYAVFVGQASWARDTYAVPTVEEQARNDPTLNADPNWAFIIDAMSYGRPAIFNPYYPNMLEVLGPAVDAVLLGRMTSQQALDEAQAKAEAEIRRMRGS